MEFNTKTIIIIIVIVSVVFITSGVLIVYFSGNKKTLSGDKQYYCYNDTTNKCFTNKTCLSTVGYDSERKCLDSNQNFFCYDSATNKCVSDNCVATEFTKEEDCLSLQKYCLDADNNKCYTENCKNGSPKSECETKLLNYCLNKDTNSCTISSTTCANGEDQFTKAPKSECRKKLIYYCYNSDKNECENTPTCVYGESEYTNKDECTEAEKQCYKFNEEQNECNQGPCSDKDNFPDKNNCNTKVKSYCIEGTKCIDTCATEKKSTSKFACIKEDLGIDVQGDFKVVVSSGGGITFNKLTLGPLGELESLNGTITTSDTKVRLKMGTKDKDLLPNDKVSFSYTKEDGRFYCSITDTKFVFDQDTDSAVVFEFSKVTE